MAATPLTELKGVGPALAKTLERLGLFVVEDLLFLLQVHDRIHLAKIIRNVRKMPNVMKVSRTIA